MSLLDDPPIERDAKAGYSTICRRPAAESWLLDTGFAVTTWIDGKRGVAITNDGVNMLDEVFA